MILHPRRKKEWGKEGREEDGYFLKVFNRFGGKKGGGGKKETPPYLRCRPTSSLRRKKKKIVTQQRLSIERGGRNQSAILITVAVAGRRKKVDSPSECLRKQGRKEKRKKKEGKEKIAFSLQSPFREVRTWGRKKGGGAVGQIVSCSSEEEREKGGEGPNYISDSLISRDIRKKERERGEKKRGTANGLSNSLFHDPIIWKRP